MNEHEKAPVTGTTATEAAAETATLGGAAVSRTNFNTVDKHGQDYLIAGLLGTGKANALTARELASLLGLSDPRFISREVERERRAGCPICASSGLVAGYYLPDSVEEFHNYLKSLKRRMNHIALTQRSLEQAFARMSGQGQMVGW